MWRRKDTRGRGGRERVKAEEGCMNPYKKHTGKGVKEVKGGKGKGEGGRRSSVRSVRSVRGRSVKNVNSYCE